MMLRALKIGHCAWILQVAFDDVGRENYALAKNNLDKIEYNIKYIGYNTNLGIQFRILKLFVDLQLTGLIYIGSLIMDIRRTNAFNDNEKALLLKYILSIIYLSFPKSRKDALTVARKLVFDQTRVNGMLRRRYEGCERILSNPDYFVA